MTDDLVKKLRSVDVSWSYEGELCAWAADRIEQLEAALHKAYEDCINAVNKIKTDALTVAAVHHKIAYTKTLTAEDFMVAIAEDIEREIKLRAALRGGGK